MDMINLLVAIFKAFRALVEDYNLDNELPKKGELLFFVVCYYYE